MAISLKRCAILEHFLHPSHLSGENHYFVPSRQINFLRETQDEILPMLLLLQRFPPGTCSPEFGKRNKAWNSIWRPWLLAGGFWLNIISKILPAWDQYNLNKITNWNGPALTEKSKVKSYWTRCRRTGGFQWGPTFLKSCGTRTLGY